MIRLISCLLLAVTLAAGEADANAIAAADNALAVKLYHELGKQEGNLFFSPYSIHTALSMTWAGAKGQTATEMAEVLALGDKAPVAVAGGHGALAEGLGEAGEGVRLEIANALYGAEKYPFLPDFLALNKQHFGAGLELCDFAGQPDVERKRINKWVEEQTEKKIVDLLPPGSIFPLVRLVLVNAIYFKADWQNQFDQKLTADADFGPTCPPGKEVAPLGKVPLMHRKGKMAYYDTDLIPMRPKGPPPSAHVVCLPYVGEQVEFLLMLPKQDTPAALSHLEAKFGQVLTACRPRQRKVHLWLPRFEMRWGTESLKQALIDLGMPTPFEQGKADFSGMAECATSDALCIADVYHQAYVKLDEEGTEAAAATAVVMKGRSVAVDPPPVVVRADRPFLFVIRHKSTKAVLFVGRVANPCK